MSLLRRLVAYALAAWVLGCVSTAPVPTPGGSEQEARAAFVKLVEVARQGRLAQFKSMIAPADLKEMEAMEKDNPGFFAMLMGFVAEGGDPSEYTAEVEPDRVTFVRRVSQKTPDLSSTETTTVTLIRQGNRWLFGKPRP